MGVIVHTEFTPWMSFGGGVLIGLSAVMLMALLGKIAGIAGITKGMLSALLPMAGTPSDWGWRLAFIVGLVASPLFIALVTGQLPEQTVSSNVIGMATAGLLVGFGTGMGSGCTSGHGVCGLARLSVRSLVAVIVFMVSAAITVFVVRHGGLL